MKESKQPGVFMDKRRGRMLFFTESLVPGKKVYDERLIREKGIEYREWNVRKSKVGAALAKGVKDLGIKRGDKILYLGCSTGTTASHISDVVGMSGVVFGLDFAPRVMREFVFLSEQRENMIPILADCKKPEEYADRLFECDVLIQDIAQKDQVGILLKNLQFLKKGGIILFAVKARSIDVTAKPKSVFNKVREQLKKEVEILEYITLDPFEADHCMFICRK